MCTDHGAPTPDSVGDPPAEERADELTEHDGRGQEADERVREAEVGLQEKDRGGDRAQVIAVDKPDRGPPSQRSEG